jgi:pimeloyl-ACP methyl ester carboxylesterase
MTSDPAPFTVAVEESVLDDLRARLRRTRWPADLDNADWSYGMNAAYLRDFCAYWAEEFDWHAQAAAINELDHFLVEIDGLPIHYVNVRSAAPDATPLLLCHGWPWTFWDFHRIIQPLVDTGFDLVIPSLPGFAYSTPLPRAGVSFVETADAFATLMTRILGYERFAVHGSDFGSVVAAQLGHKYADRVIALHTTSPGRLDFLSGERPWDLGGVPASGLPDGIRRSIIEWQSKIAAHVAVHVLDPQTLSYGMHDSPAALAAWFLVRRYMYSDCRGDLENSFSRDDLCTLLTIYWATESFVSSVRYYREAALARWRPSHDRKPVVEAPTGVSHFIVDMPTVIINREAIGRYYNLLHYRQYETGGHFAAAESPEVVVDDIIGTVAAAREQSG